MAAVWNMSSVSTRDMSSVATKDMSFVETEDMKFTNPPPCALTGLWGKRVNIFMTLCEYTLRGKT